MWLAFLQAKKFFLPLKEIDFIFFTLLFMWLYAFLSGFILLP